MESFNKVITIHNVRFKLLRSMRIFTFEIRKGHELAWIQYTVLDKYRNWGEQSKSNFTF